ncbi:MAG: lysophospholipid acyltransferase family protein [Victivallaceae bacterium]|nr:lysophospholipid acyltransferase family protein [Victivallaceae bacterium]
MIYPELAISKNDQYNSPEGRLPSFACRFFPGTNAYFFASNFEIFIASGRLARKGRLDGVNQIHMSARNITLIERCGGHVHIEGLDHLRSLDGKPVVIVANHMSLLETAVLHAIVRPHLDFSFVIKKSLLKIPYFGDILRSFNAIAVSRENAREDLKTVLNEGRKLLEEGRSIVLFPQSTRSVQFIPENFNTIGEKLARDVGVPVVPLALKTDFVRNGRWIKELGSVDIGSKVCFSFASPLAITHENAKDVHRQILSFIGDRLESWRAER